MTSKLFELRDKGTFVPVLCTLMESAHDQERWLLSRAGYEVRSNLILMTGLAGLEKSAYSPYAWGPNRTRHVAHLYITEYWDELMTGAVIDVEFILGETQTAKTSERKP